MTNSSSFEAAMRGKHQKTKTYKANSTNNQI